MEFTQRKAVPILDSQFSCTLEYKLEYVKYHINAMARNIKDFGGGGIDNRREDFLKGL